METGRGASDVRLRYVPLVKPFRAARPDTPIVLVEVLQGNWIFTWIGSAEWPSP